MSSFKNKELGWGLFFFRIILSFLLLLGTLYYQKFPSHLIGSEQILPLYSLLLTTFALNFLFLNIKKYFVNQFYYHSLQIVYDTAFVSALILITDTEDSLFTFFYLLVIILAAVLENKRGALIATFATCIFYLGVLFFGNLEYGSSVSIHSLAQLIAFFITGALAGILIEELKKRQNLLEITELELLRVQDLQKLIIAELEFGLVLLNPEGKLIHWNRPALNILGLEANNSNLENMDLEVLLARVPLWQKAFYEHRQQLKNTQQLPQAVYTQRIDQRLYSLSMKTLVSKNSAAQGYLLCFVDVSELDNAQNELRNQERLAAIGRLSASIAHEIRNPLASISGSCEMLQSGSHLAAEDLALLGIIQRESRRLNLLISELMDYVKPEAMSLIPGNIFELLNETITELKLHQASQGVACSLESSLDNSICVPLAKDKLKQVFLNLGINALQALQEKKEKAAAENDTFQALFQIRLAKYGQRSLEIIFQDNGAGISEAHQKRLFEPFFTTKKKGTGLGLALVYKIVQEHHGEIRVESQQGKGSKFQILLPL